MKILYRLTDAEIREKVPYTVLAECENKLATGRARRLMEQLGISPEMLARYQQQARQWHLVAGLADSYAFTMEELADWNLIGQLLINL